MPSELPFYLQPGEEIVRDAAVMQYYGVSLINLGFAGGGITDGGLGGGIFTSKQHKREKSLFDATNCHAYLTNNRLVFVKAKFNLGVTEETGLDTIFSDIPLNFIEGLVPGKKLTHPTIDLSVRSPNGEINKIAVAFLISGGKKSFFENVNRTPERDEWIKLIESYRQGLLQKAHQPPSKHEEDPIKILKLRYAKGEITKDEYNEMLGLLEQ